MITPTQEWPHMIARCAHHGGRLIAVYGGSRADAAEFAAAYPAAETRSGATRTVVCGDCGRPCVLTARISGGRGAIRVWQS